MVERGLLDNQSLILSYIKNNNINDLKYLESINIQLNLERYLIAACHVGNIDMVKYFIHMNTNYCVSKVLKKCIKFKQCVVLEYILSLVRYRYRDIKNSVYVYCVDKGDLEILKILFNNTPDDYTCRFYYESAVLSSIKGNKIEILKYLIDIDKYISPLYEDIILKCIRLKRQEMLKYIILYSPRQTITNTIIKYCIYTENVQVLKFIIEKNIESFYDLDSLMLLACNNNCIEIVNYVIDKVNISSKFFTQPIKKNYTVIINKLLLHSTYVGKKVFLCAISTKNIEMIKQFIPKSLDHIQYAFSYFINDLEITTLLLDLGLKPTTETLKICTNKSIIKLFIFEGLSIPEEVLISSCKNGHINNVKLLLNCGHVINDKVLKATIYSGSRDLLQLLINRGVNITIQDNYIVKYACLEDNLEQVKLLVENGADLTAENSICIRYACLKGNVNIVKYLMEQGIELKDELFEDSLKSNNLELLEFLIQNGICPIDLNDLLILATKNLSLEFIKFLVDKGADINYCNGAPIIISVKSRNLEITKYLISKGANVKVSNNSVLLHAVNEGSLELTKLLIENGADPKDNNKHTCITLAINKCWSIVDYLINNHYGGLYSFIETFEIKEIVNKVMKKYKYELIYKGPITDMTEKECGVCLQEMHPYTYQLLQCLVCKKCIHRECSIKWGKNCIYCRN